MEDVNIEAKNGRRKGILKTIWTSAELPFFFYVFGLMLHMPLLHQYAYLRFSEQKGFPYSYSSKDSTCGTVFNKTLNDLQEKVQATTAHFQIGQSLCNTVPSLVMCLFLGAWSDTVGRKPIIVLGIFGAFLESLVVFMTMIFNFPIAVVYIGAFLNGLGGYFTGLTLAVMAYIADTTEKEKRALRLGIMEAVIFTAAMTSNFTSGHFISRYGFKIPYILVVCCFAVACLCSIFALSESISKKALTVASSINKSCLKYPLQVWHVLTKPRPGKWKIGLLLPATLLVNMLTIGISSVITLYLLNSPFCLPSIEVGYFIGTRFLIMGFGAALGIKLLSRWMPSHFIGFLGIFSYICFYSLLGLAKSKKMLYLACAAGVVSGTVGPIFRGILSKSVEAEEQGALFSAVSSLEMFAVFLGHFLFNGLYPVVNDRGHPGAVFFLVDILLVVPFLFNLIYTIKLKQKGETPEDLKKIMNDFAANSGDDCPRASGYESAGSTPPQSPVSS